MPGSNASTVARERPRAAPATGPALHLRAGAGRIPLIAHIIHGLDVGGLENGLVNLINRIPAERYRHAIICMTDYSDFRARLRPRVEIHALHKRAGKDPRTYWRLYRLLRRLGPDIVHTRNLATLEGQLMAALAGVRCRVHGEHGWDMEDLNGSSRKYRLLRRLCRPLVQHYIPLSQDLEAYLGARVGVPAIRITRICNGVDTERFRPAPAGRAPLPVAGFVPPGTFVLGTVGRLKAVKDPLNLVRAFLHLLERVPEARTRLRLVMVGDGPLRAEARRLLEEAGAGALAWLPGSREDVPALLRGLDLFVLPSLAEGICNGILEAMASGLPVVATRVGGNPELVAEGETGLLVPPADPVALAAALQGYLERPALRQAHARAARERAVRCFSMATMVARYLEVYDALLDRKEG